MDKGRNRKSTGIVLKEMETITTKGLDEFLSRIEFSSSILPENLVQQADLNKKNTDFPTSKTEAWKYTRVGKISKGNFAFAPPTGVVLPEELKNLENRVVFVNGVWSQVLSSLSPESGVEVAPLVDVLEKDWVKNHLGENVILDGEPFNCLNTLLCQGGVAVKIGKNTISKQPLYIVNIMDGEAVLTVNRNILLAEEGSNSTVAEIFIGHKAKNSFNNNITEIFVKENAALTLSKIQAEEETNFHINAEQVSQEQNSQFEIRTFTFNGGIVRNTLNVDVNGSNCITNLFGAYLGKGKQHIDNHTTIDHRVGYCESNELYKGVLDGHSTAVFNGKVYVRKDAQKINAFQSNKNVLLSDTATVNSKPELEIYADDVKCSHGSTIGQMDEDALFYLRSRGITEKTAKNLMVGAFVGEVLEREKDETLLNILNQLASKRFDWSL